MEQRRRAGDRLRGRVAVLLLLGLGGCANLHEQLKPDLADDYPQATYYTAITRSGDSLADVAARYGADPKVVASINDLHGAPAPGQVLKIPAGSHTTRTRILTEALGKPLPKTKSIRVAVLPPPHARAVVQETPQPESFLDRADAIIDSFASGEPETVASVAVPRPRPDYETAPQTEVAQADAPQAPQAAVVQGAQLTANARFVWPVTGRIISPFGVTPSGERNDGINIAAAEGEKIHAAAGGVVTYAGNELKSYGNLVLIKHDDGYVTAYAHTQNILVEKGARVEKGEIIATAGMTGDVDAPQLHFEIRRGGRPVDPKPMLVAER